jgi:hypothetical protein
MQKTLETIISNERDRQKGVSALQVAKSDWTAALAALKDELPEAAQDKPHIAGLVVDAFGASTITGVESMGAGTMAVAAGAAACAGVAGYGAGTALDKGFNVSDYSSQADFAV